MLISQPQPALIGNFTDFLARIQHQSSAGRMLRS
jgi:hypothetical protein